MSGTYGALWTSRRGESTNQPRSVQHPSGSKARQRLAAQAGAGETLTLEPDGRHDRLRDSPVNPRQGLTVGGRGRLSPQVVLDAHLKTHDLMEQSAGPRPRMPVVTPNYEGGALRPWGYRNCARPRRALRSHRGPR
jgi:hypothetical protein